jgi:hypothetical protein
VRNITYSKGEEYPAKKENKEGYLDWSHLA